MLIIKKIDCFSIHFIFDLETVKEMLFAFQKTFSSKQLTEIGNAQIDLKIFKSRKKEPKEMKLLLNRGEGNFYIQNSSCILELDDDDLEWGIRLLKGYMKSGGFEVAEFTKVKIPGKNVKWLFQIYFIEQSL